MESDNAEWKKVRRDDAVRFGIGITTVYADTLRKWIMLDPTFGCYVTDERCAILNVPELREALAAQREVKFNQEMQYHHEKSDAREDETRAYYAKDLFYFTCFEKSRYGQASGGGDRLIAFAPNGFDVKKNRIENIRFRIRSSGKSERLLSWLRETTASPVVYGRTEDFVKSP